MRYITGSNVPGYMPDETPSEHESWLEARNALASDIERDANAAADALAEDALADTALPELDRYRDAALLEVGRTAPGTIFDVRFNGRVYFLASEAE